MLYVHAGEPTILSRGINKNEFCPMLEAFLDDASGCPTLSSARRTKDGAMPSEESFRLYGYCAFLRNIHGPQIKKYRLFLFGASSPSIVATAQ